MSEEVNITLPGPFDRSELPTYSNSWSFEMIKLKQKKMVPLCLDIADVVELTSTPLAISGKHEQGFIKKIQPMKWPTHVPEWVKDGVLSSPRFTLTLWAYVSEPCRYDFCEILSHRDSLNFLTPVLLLTKAGLIHVQVHNSEGSGEAFVTNQPAPLKEWFYLVFTLNGNEMEERGYLNLQMNLFCRFNSLEFKSEAGVWNIGGYFGFAGIRGLVCCVKLYRRKALQPEEILYPTNATRLLEISGCLGYLESFVSSSISKYFSRDDSISKKEAISKLFYAAIQDSELAQLALSYKHQLGVDDMHKDLNIAAGYSKAAAMAVKKILENEEQYIHTHSEMIRLDEAHLYAGKRGMSSDVMKWLKRQADWGSTDAQSKMADILFHGQHGIDAQRHEAVNLYRAGAEQGDANSMYNLGVLHLRGIEVDKNETKAVELFQKAAMKNYTIAFNSLGYHELVNRKNISGALHFWRLAANMGDKDAMTNLGIQYENGITGVLESNKTKAFNLFRKSAEQGQKDGCIKYADYLITGAAGEFNSFLAIRFYRYVAEQLPTIGLYLRNAFGSYEEGQWNTSLVMYMTVAETGLALGSYNTALLCEEMLPYHMNTGSLGGNCSLHFFNISANLGWPASIVRMGDEYWYGDRVEANLTKAVMNYIWITKDQDSPQALFNLGYLIENNISIKGINFGDTSGAGYDRKSVAKLYYQRYKDNILIL
eukprot:gene16684-8126_t